MDLVSQNPTSTLNLRRHTPIPIAGDLIHHQVSERKSPALKSSLEADTMEETPATSTSIVRRLPCTHFPSQSHSIKVASS